MIEIHVRKYGVIRIELDRRHAPNTCANFVSLARKGFYDGLIFHRVIANFMIQGGDPLGKGIGGPGYTIRGEFRANGADNPLSHLRGTVSMARKADFDSAGSLFFFMHRDGTYLDGQYAAFGKVISGMEVVDRIARTATSPNDRPLEPVVIESIRAIDEPVVEVEILAEEKR